MAIAQPAHAKLLQVLLWYEEPQIVLLQPRPHEFIVGVAIDSEEMHSGFVGAHVSVRQLVQYMMQKIDLRYLYLKPDLKKWWIFDLDTESDTVSLKRLKGSDSRVDDNAPETGFFYRFHDEIKNIDIQVANSVQKFDIDGSWELGEFSQFYGQVEDIYYLFHSVDEYKNPSSSYTRKKQIEDSLVRPFRGGGSYRGMYNDFANDNDRAAKLRVNGIQYHSPGYVEVRALEKPFEDSIKLLQNFSSSRDEIKGYYRALHGTLSKNKLLKKESRITSTELRDTISDQAKELATQMPGLSVDDFLRMTGGELLVSAKVLLSIVRRVDKLFQFFDEGRAKHPRIFID